MFIDTHAHLTDKIYDGNIEEIRNNYLNAGISKVIVVGYNLSSSVKAYELSKKYDVDENFIKAIIKHTKYKNHIRNPPLK